MCPGHATWSTIFDDFPCSLCFTMLGLLPHWTIHRFCLKETLNPKESIIGDLRLTDIYGEKIQLLSLPNRVKDYLLTGSVKCYCFETILEGLIYNVFYCIIWLKFYLCIDKGWRNRAIMLAVVRVVFQYCCIFLSISVFTENVLTKLDLMQLVVCFCSILT